MQMSKRGTSIFEPDDIDIQRRKFLMEQISIAGREANIAGFMAGEEMYKENRTSGALQLANYVASHFYSALKENPDLINDANWVEKANVDVCTYYEQCHKEDVPISKEMATVAQWYSEGKIGLDEAKPFIDRDNEARYATYSEAERQIGRDCIAAVAAIAQQFSKGEISLAEKEKEFGVSEKIYQYQLSLAREQARSQERSLFLRERMQRSEIKPREESLILKREAAVATKMLNEQFKKLGSEDLSYASNNYYAAFKENPDLIYYPAFTEEAIRNIQRDRSFGNPHLEGLTSSSFYHLSESEKQDSKDILFAVAKIAKQFSTGELDLQTEEKKFGLGEQSKDSNNGLDEPD